MSVSKALRAALGGDCAVIDDVEILKSYERDQAPFAPSAKAAAVLIAKSVDEVSKAVKFANQESIPVVIRGAGSGLAGGANSIQGCIVISLEKLNKILEIDPINQIARVEAGVINSDLDKAAEEFGLTYLPDPASRSWSTIGGNIATNAGGMCCGPHLGLSILCSS